MCIFGCGQGLRISVLNFFDGHIGQIPKGHLFHHFLSKDPYRQVGVLHKEVEGNGDEAERKTNKIKIQAKTCSVTTWWRKEWRSQFSSRCPPRPVHLEPHSCHNKEKYSIWFLFYCVHDDPFKPTKKYKTSTFLKKPHKSCSSTNVLYRVFTFNCSALKMTLCRTLRNSDV